MSSAPILSSRKADHIEINLDQDVSSGLTSGLENYSFLHNALPEISLDSVDLTQKLFGKLLLTPILISSMTGGTEKGALVNRNLALAAQEVGAAMGLGSQRVALEHPETADTFKVRKYAPDILLLANLGAVQLNYGYGIEQCKRAVEMIEADALILHLNPLQEALQPEGETDFSGLLNQIEMVCRKLSVPVIVKEVGWGISQEVASRLASVGVSAIDVAGAGGTSWSQVEMHRHAEEDRAQIAAAFRNWGIPTSESILQAKRGAPSLPIFASGGVKSGVDIAKCIALGAVLGGMAGKFLKAAVVSPDEILTVLNQTRDEIRICMFGVGVDRLEKLQEGSLFRIR